MENPQSEIRYFESDALVEAQSMQAISESERALNKLDPKEETLQHRIKFREDLGSMVVGNTTQREPAQTWHERRVEDRIYEKVDKLEQARYRRDSALKKGPMQTYGVRPAWRRRGQRSEAKEQLKNGHISRDEYEYQKLVIKANRSGTAIRGADQRRTARRSAYRTIEAKAATREFIAPTVRNLKLKNMHKKINEHFDIIDQNEAKLRSLQQEKILSPSEDRALGRLKRL